MKNKKAQDRVYILAGYTPWSKDVFNKRIVKYPGRWYLISEPSELTESSLKRINPQYIFFLHWSWKVPKNIIENYKCVCFHMTDVPYGRGGTPLQNLIIRGHRATKLTALKMGEEFDAGPVYLKRPLSLEGRAEEVYIRASNLSAEMILNIIKNNPTPKKQKGRVVVFKRRKPEESEIPECKNIQKLYDFIRMLDADEYPMAFINYKGFVFEFSRSALDRDRILCNVIIKKFNKKSK